MRSSFRSRVVGSMALTLIAFVLMPACGKQAGDTAAGAVSTTAPLISRSLLFGNPEKASIRISPDGKYLSFLAPVDGVMNVWVGPADDPSAAKPVTKDTKRGIRYFGWPYNTKYLVYIQDKDGDENWHLYRVDLETNETVNMTPFDGVQARFVHDSPKHPDETLIAINKRDPKLHDIHRLNLVTGKMKLVEKNTKGYLGYMADDDFNLVATLKVTKKGGQEIFLRKGKKWKSAIKFSMEDSANSDPVALSPDGKKLYLTDSRERDTAALKVWDLKSKKFEEIASNDKADASRPMFHPATRELQAVAFEYTRLEWTFFDDAVKADFDVLAKVDRGEMFVGSRTHDDATWIVVFVPDDGPVKYYRYDRADKKATFLFTNRPELEGKKLARMYPAVIKARDGLDLVSYYSLPPSFDKDGKAKSPLPLVLNVHGGPWGRDRWGYDPEHQWLANRGYAVLSVNFRGSTGLGKKFMNAGNMEWAGKMHDDLLDAVKWAVDQGIADPKKVAIYGGSYGGYATLVGLTFTPEEFTCGVDIVGPSNLLTLLSTIPPYWAPMIDMFTSRVGDHRTDEGKKLLEERSPLNKADAIVRPLLIAQGANDPRVKQAESDQIVAKMEEKKIPVTYVLYADEGHGFRRPENRTSFYAISEGFLSKCLGGRMEPYGNDFDGANFTVPAGADYVPGLADAVKPAAAVEAKPEG